MNLLLTVGLVVKIGSKAWLSNVAGAIPGEADIVDPSTRGSAYGPVVPDGDNSATPMIPCDAFGPADAPVIQREVDPVIPNEVASTCDGDPDDVAPKIPCEDASMIPAPVSRVPVTPGNAYQ